MTVDGPRALREGAPRHDVRLLEREVAHLRALVEATSDWVWEVDADGRYTYSSPRVRELLGYDIPEVLGRTPFDFMDPDEASRVRTVFRDRVAARAELRNLINVNRHKSGREVVLETCGVPLVDEHGAFAGYRGIDRDVTERLRLARRLQLSDAAVRAAAEGIVVADVDGRITAANQAFLALTGLTEGEVLGHPPTMLSCGEDERSRVWDRLRGEAHWSGEGTCRHRTGDSFPVWLTLSAVREPSTGQYGHVALVSDMTERRAAEATVRFQATHDPLTQLANRGAFLHALARGLTAAEGRAEQLAVLFVDLDGFKAVNDRHGHAVGDVLLGAVARRLERCARKTDLVARFGGDEFTVLLRDLTSRQVARRVARAIVTALSAPFRAEGVDLHVTGSVGVAVFPEDGRSADAILAAADRAMYAAKHGGGDRVSPPPHADEGPRATPSAGRATRPFRP